MERVPPSLPDDIIAEILSRVPYKSLCRFKCVSRPWLALCSDPSVRRKCPQTRSGFFFDSTGFLQFVNVSGRGPPMVDPSLSFLPAGSRDLIISDCCNGLLLCKRKSAQHGSIYFVCNPATEEWMDLPDTERMKTSDDQTIRLGFDPAVSSHLCVFLLVYTETNVRSHYRVTGVEIYSSETGRWTYWPSLWGDDTTLLGTSSTSAFFNSTLHLRTFDFSVITVDTDGKTWRTIYTPGRHFDFIGQFKRQLYAVHRENEYQLSVWVLEDTGGHQYWILKQIASPPIGQVHAIHLENNLIFLTVGAGLQRNLISYDIDTREVNITWTLGANSSTRLDPYIPCLSDWLPGRH